MELNSIFLAKFHENPMIPETVDSISVDFLPLKLNQISLVRGQTKFMGYTYTELVEFED